jgi:hypothetical protein
MTHRAILLIALLLAGCVGPPERGPRQSKAKLTAPSAELKQCMRALNALDVTYERTPDRKFGGGCNIRDAVKVSKIDDVVLSGAGSMRCPVALKLAQWLQQDAQPAARQTIGSPIRAIESYGTYACRPVNNQIGGRLSEHGRANAIDLAAFRFANGERVSLLKGWRGDNRDARAFLRRAHKSGCQHFSIVLGPEANRQHHDHFHFDLGPGTYCK